MAACLTFHKSQRGAALFVSLVFLLLLTIIGVVGMQGAVMQEKMAGNNKFKNQSFQYAEAALREGEGLIASDVNAVNIAACSTCVGDDCRAPSWSSISVSSGTCDVWKSASDGKSHYQLQKLGASSDAVNVVNGEVVTLFRVTAVATVGGVTTALESIYAKN